ncbi:putative phage holin [Streptomyces cinereoruber]|uniref:putative phage holin n=1 Tax=Streptomyces cinereoruber TaxID=67260 RepID=UPI003638EA8A
MLDQSIDQWINMIASGAAALACAVFAIVYHRRTTWWRSDIGRNLMGFAAVVGALCLYTILITLWPTGCPSVILRAARTGIVLSIAALMIQRTLLVIRAQRTPDLAPPRKKP